MNILIVYCHPEPSSFNGSLRDVAIKTFEADGNKVEVSDLYAEKFDPVEKAEHYRQRVIMESFEPLTEQRHAHETNMLPEDVKREIERLKRCDFLLFQFPLWWHQQPAMLKGWFDRVFIAGGLYTSKMRYDRGYFKGKRAMCSITSGAPMETFTENGRAGGTINTLLHSLHFSLHYMGFSVLPPNLFTEVQGAGFTYRSSEELQKHLQAHLCNWEKYLRKIDRLKAFTFPGWEEWDEHGVERGA